MIRQLTHRSIATELLAGNLNGRLLKSLTSTFLYAVVGASVFCTGAPARADDRLQLVAKFDHQVTGVTVSSDGRIFVNFPRWTEDTAISVAELKDGKLIPYPNEEWNSWRNANKDSKSAGDHWICVQSVVADGHGSIWAIDPAAPAMGPVVEHGPKLVEIKLADNTVGRIIAFDEAVAPQGSYLNDVRFSPDGKTAYITDSGAKGALVVVDLHSGSSRRVLEGDPSTMPDQSVTVTYDGKPLRRPDGRGVEFSADGIALSPDGRTLYWQAIKGKTLYSIATERLTGFFAAAKAVMPTTVANKSFGADVKTVGINGPADGLIISRANGRMYVSSPQDDSIKVRDLSDPLGAETKPFLQDGRLRWPDTFSEASDGTIYITSSHIQDSAFFKLGAPVALPTELWKFKP